MMAVLSLLFVMPLFPVPYVPTARQRSDEHAAAGDPRFIMNACRDVEERTIMPLSMTSVFLLGNLRYPGPRALVTSGPTPIRFADDVPALSVVSNGTTFELEGKAHDGTPRSLGTVDEQGEPLGRWTFSGVAGVEWMVVFEPGASPRKGKAKSRVCPSGGIAKSLGDGTVSLACQWGGLENGRYEERDLAGGVHMRGHMIAGQRDGSWWFYDEAGCRRRLESYLDGTLSGPTAAWFGPDHADGDNIRYRGHFSDGFAVGAWQYWCDGMERIARFRPEERAWLAFTLDGCGPPARATLPEVPQ
jgi:hypothetical protein